MTTDIAQAQLTRLDVEDFLYQEAALLEAWQLDESARRQNGTPPMLQVAHGRPARRTAP